MAETKYGKYFLSGVNQQDPERGIALAYLDASIIEGSPLGRFMMMTPKETSYPMSDTHQHEYGELLIHLGTNPDDPMDLGAEVELCMGEEKEKHIITKSTVVYIPPNFVHAPWQIKKVYRPMLFAQIVLGPEMPPPIPPKR